MVTLCAYASRIIPPKTKQYPAFASNIGLILGIFKDLLFIFCHNEDGILKRMLHARAAGTAPFLYYTG